MFNSCFYFGKSEQHFEQISSKILSLNSKAEIIRFGNIYYLLETLRIYEELIVNTKQKFPSHIIIDAKPTSLVYQNFISVFEKIRIESHNIYEVSLVPMLSKDDSDGAKSIVLEQDYVRQYLDKDKLEFYQTKIT